MICTICQTSLDEMTHYCHQCGYPVDEKSYCYNCGFQLESHYRFCPVCGVALSDFKFQDSAKEKLVRLENKLLTEPTNFQLVLEIAVLRNYFGDLEKAKENFEYILANCQESEMLYKTSCRYGKILSEDHNVSSLHKSVSLFRNAIKLYPARSEVTRIEAAIESISKELSILASDTQS